MGTSNSVTCKLDYNRKVHSLFFLDIEDNITYALEYRFRYTTRWIIRGRYGSVMAHVKNWELA